MTSVVLNVEPGGNMRMKTGTEQGKGLLTASRFKDDDICGLL
jgi:hypothetical protein